MNITFQRLQCGKHLQDSDKTVDHSPVYLGLGLEQYLSLDWSVGSCVLDSMFGFQWLEHDHPGDVQMHSGYHQ